MTHGADRQRSQAPAPRSTARLPRALAPEALASRAGAAALAPGIVDRLRGRRPALFLDYDGTLTPIVARPELAVLARETREAVQSVVATGCHVAVVSGRDLDDVRRLVDLPQLIYAGSHGFDIVGPGGLRLEHPGAVAALPHLDAAERVLTAALADAPGVQIERKRFSLAVHYRRVDAEVVPRVERAVTETAAAHAALRRAHGKKVFELQPAVDWHKGRAVEWLLDCLDLDGADVLPLYLGDDLTDEDAFRALHGRGLGIVVRDPIPRPTAADYALDDTTEVRRVLVALAGL